MEFSAKITRPKFGREKISVDEWHSELQKSNNVFGAEIYEPIVFGESYLWNTDCP